MPYGKKSPAKMGHKDSAMKMGHSPMKKESAKQEKYNLIHDNPVAKHASGGSWMSKHSKSAFQMGHDSPAKKHGAMKGDQSKTRSDYENYKGTDKGYHGTTGSSHGDQSVSKADYTSPATNLGHGMDKMSAEKGAHREYHLKQRLSKKSKD